MPPSTQRRRRTANPGDEDDDEPPRRQVRRNDSDDDAEDSAHDGEGDVSMAGADGSDEQQLVKKLVRYALACEYARLPIKRDGIREKVLGNNGRSFKRVFDGAQHHLRHVFGMELSELPSREKRTLKEKQKATARKGGASQNSVSSRQYILVSILPEAYSTPAIAHPSRAPSSREEGEYVGFYTWMVSLIVLSGGELSDSKLRRYLSRMNAAQNLPIDKTENVLTKVVRQGYVDKVVEKSDHGEEDTVTWCLGPRGKTEIPAESIAGFVRVVWGEIPDDFEKKLSKSLGLREPVPTNGTA